jgi:hypothetical protein
MAGALGIAGPPAAPTMPPVSSAVRGSITTHVGHALRWHYSILTDTVLTTAPGTILPKNCGASKTFSRLWDITLASNDSVAVWADSIVVLVTPICKVEIPVPPPTDTTFKVFAATDFESGTIAPFYDPWAGSYPADWLAVISDPTNSGRGKVLSIRYANFPENGNYDNNHGIALNPNDSSTISYGEEVIFTGDLYIAKGPTDSLLLADGLRKFNYWCSNDTDWSVTPPAKQNHFCFIFTTQANGKGTTGTSQQMEWVVDLFGTQIGSAVTVPLQYGYTGLPLTQNVWHRLTIDLRLNSSPSRKDGVLRIALDNTTVLNRSDIWFIDPSWGASQKLQLSDWRIGYQVNSSSKVDETRYWDNLKFTIKKTVH